MTTLTMIMIYAIPLTIAVRAIILAITLVVDAIIGEPDMIWRYLPHPVVLFGRLIRFCSASWHSNKTTGCGRRIRGVFAISFLVLIAAMTGFALTALA
ncbi:MAG: cobalamin biosynthesis protein, partial [Candidatus Puniceispirillales bacterium]